ncbi:MAG TPA: AraC family transcriptional regulator [Nannocystis sp.]|jgi:AraC-like DNA-binding protein
MADQTEEQLVRAGSVSRRHGAPPWQVDAGDRTSLHVVVDGSFRLTRDAAPTLALEPGDVVLVAAPQAHSLRCLATGATRHAELLSASYDATPLPTPVVHLSAADVRRSPGLAALVSLLRAALAEPGAAQDGLARSLLAPLLTYTLHCHDVVGDGPAARAHDRRIARALEVMQARPTERWTVAAHARAAGLSRAAFARRFLAELGVPPLRHLTELRMRRAARRLAESDDSLAAIAAEVGYDSEFAFSRAFKRHMGEAPGGFRRRSRVEGTFAPPIVCLAA